MQTAHGYDCEKVIAESSDPMLDAKVKGLEQDQIGFKPNFLMIEMLAKSVAPHSNKHEWNSK